MRAAATNLLTCSFLGFLAAPSGFSAGSPPPTPVYQMGGSPKDPISIGHSGEGMRPPTLKPLNGGFVGQKANSEGLSKKKAKKRDKIGDENVSYSLRPIAISGRLLQPALSFEETPLPAKMVDRPLLSEPLRQAEQ